MTNVTHRASWRTWLRTMLLATTAVAAGGAASAHPYPDRPVTIVVAFAPGGMTDTVSRNLARGLGDVLKQPFIIENKAGAAGQVGTEYVARRPADGYTLLVSSGSFVIGPAVQKKVGYDPINSFEPVAVLAKAPNLVLVNPSVPVQNMAELLTWGKTQSSIPYGSAGAGGATHLAGEMLRHESGIPLVHIPYKGAAPSTADLVAGQIPAAIEDSMSVAAFVASGKLRPLAVTGAERSKLFPDLPTLSEAGIKDIDVYTWLGLYAPAGTPAEIVAKLNEAVIQVMNSPELVKRLRDQNSEPMPPLTPAEMKKFVASEVSKYREMVKVTGVKVDE